MNKLAYILLLISLISCKKEIDLAKIDKTDSNWNQEYYFPIGFSNLKFNELQISKDSIITFDSTGLAHISYNENILTYPIDSFISIPNDTIIGSYTLAPISLPDLIDTNTIKLESAANQISNPLTKDSILSSDGQILSLFPKIDNLILADQPNIVLNGFSSATFSSGNIEIELKNEWGFDIASVTLTISDNLSNINEKLVFSNLQNNSSQIKNISLIGKTIGNVLIPTVSAINVINQSNISVDLTNTISLITKATNLIITSGNAIISSSEVRDTIKSTIKTAPDAQLKTIALTSGILQYTIDYSFQETSAITLSIPAITKKGVPLTITEPTVNSNIPAKNIDLTNYIIDLTEGGITSNSITAYVTGNLVSSNTEKTFNTTNTVQASIKLLNLKQSKVIGYFGKSPINLATDTINFEIPGSILTDNDIVLTNPTIKFNIQNSVGIPLSANISPLKVINTSNNTSADFTNLPTNIFENTTPTNIGETKLKTIELGKNNNIDNIISSTPNKLIYALTNGFTNPNSDTTIENFITDKSKIQIDMGLDIPLDAKINSFIFSDTLEFGVVLDYDPLKLAIRIYSENGFPLESVLQLYTCNSSYIITDSLIDNGGYLLPIGTINNGRVITPSITSTDIILDKSKQTSISQSKHIIMSMKVITNNGGNPVKFYSTDFLNIQIGLKATLNNIPNSGIPL